jgi:heat shock protein beta
VQLCLFLPCRPNEIEDSEYNEFYKSFTKESEDPMAKTHFTAEGEVTFKSILFIPKNSPNDMFQDYGKTKEAIKVCK